MHAPAHLRCMLQRIYRLGKRLTKEAPEWDLL